LGYRHCNATSLYQRAILLCAGIPSHFNQFMLYTTIFSEN
jgi:hypothetical protein